MVFIIGAVDMPAVPLYTYSKRIHMSVIDAEIDGGAENE